MIRKASGIVMWLALVALTLFALFQPEIGLFHTGGAGVALGAGLIGGAVAFETHRRQRA